MEGGDFGGSNAGERIGGEGLENISGGLRESGAALLGDVLGS